LEHFQSCRIPCLSGWTDNYPSAMTHPSRGTRLGEFSPIGRLFSLGSFKKVHTEGAQIFGANFFHGNCYELLVTKGGCGYKLGYILHLIRSPCTQVKF
jgi:hypothetical protein